MRAAAGWEPYRDEGFIGLVGPFWTRQEGETHLFAFTAQPKHHNRRGVVQGGMLMLHGKGVAEEMPASRAIPAIAKTAAALRGQYRIATTG